MRTPFGSTVAAVLGAAAVMGCEATPATAPADDGLLVAAEAATAATRTYEVTIRNLTGGQPLTPPLVATHRRPADVFTVGQPASFGVKEIAENGNLGPLESALNADAQVSSVVIAVGSPPPVLPGGSISFQIDAGPGAKFVSWVSMLICTNDGFTGLDSARLPKGVGDVVTRSTAAYDAGTEINTEDFFDIVPPCPGLTNQPTTDPGAGASNPALAEGGVIHHHPGIQGGDDLNPAVHGWANPVASIEVRRIR